MRQVGTKGAGNRIIDKVYVHEVVEMMFAAPRVLLSDESQKPPNTPDS